MDVNSQEEQYQYQTPSIRWLGYAVWFIFAILSIVFFEERAAFMDGAFQLVNLINTEEFSIHHYRLTNPLTQILPLLAVKIGLSLKSVMIGYSINFIIFHLFIYILIIEWCKNDFLGLVQIGFFTLFVTQSFYFLTPEYFQGTSILLLWTSILLQPSFSDKKWRYPLLMLLLIPIIFDHALLSVFFIFIWVFFWLHSKSNRNWKFGGLLAFMIFVYVIHDAYFTGWYDVARKEHFWRHWNQYFPYFNEIPAHRIFLDHCIDTYYLFPLFLVILSICYIRAKIIKTREINAPILKLILVYGFCFLFILINHINDPNTPFLFYSQVNYMGLTIPLLIPLCFDFLPRINHKKAVIYAIAFLLVIRLATILNSGFELKKRHAWMIDTIEKSNSKKVYLFGNEVPKELLIQIWSVPEETLLLTSLEDPKNAASIFVKRSDYKYHEAIDSNHVFLRSHSVQPIIEMNANYFQLDSGYYKKIGKPIE